MVKRARLIRSSSLGETSPLDRLVCFDPADGWCCKPTVKKAAVVRDSGEEVADFRPWKPRNGGEVNQGSVKQGGWSVGVTCENVEKRTARFEEFGKKCYSCQKEFKKDDDVFMIGTILRAFCSSKCRKMHIDANLEWIAQY